MRQVAKKGLITMVATGGVLAVTGGCGYAYADATAAGANAGSPGVLSGNSVQIPVHVPVNVCGNTVDVVGALNPAFGNSCANHSSGTGTAVGGGAAAQGSTADSPGVASGNSVQVPVHAPVNACGNSANVVGALNPSFGNGCANDAAGGSTGGGAVAQGGSSGSPGVGSGNTVQVPVHAPVNACGNSVDVVGVLNPVFGNSCGNGAAPTTPSVPTSPVTPTRPTVPSPPVTPPTRSHVPPAHGYLPPQPVHPGQQTLAYTGVEHLGLVGAAGAGAMIGGFVLYRRGRALRG